MLPRVIIKVKRNLAGSHEKDYDWGVSLKDIKIRVTEPELVWLRRLARSREVSIATLFREGVGLEALATGGAREGAGRKPKVPVDPKTNAA